MSQGVAEAVPVDGWTSRLEPALSEYLEPTELGLVRRAYELGAEAHSGQKRRSGEPYIEHPLAVAKLLADLRMDAETLAAAILHDTVEDTALTKEQVGFEFNTSIADLVDGVTKLDRVHFSSRREAQAASFRKMLLAMARDIRVILIKLADRLHNMRTIDSMSREAQRRIARETIEIYAPIAHRLGIETMRRELESLSFKTLYPQRYKVIAERVERAHGRRQERLSTVAALYGERLREENIVANIEGRIKEPYSIYRKMRARATNLQEILDIIGFRIVVPTVSDCYRTLGVVHGIHKPHVGRFKDYIAIPKTNGYQSLHTTLFGPDGDPIEIQIRTPEMDVVADHGIAAHWAYKLGESADSQHGPATEWLRGAIDMQPQLDDSVSFLEHVKHDLFPEEIYVFTPEGDIKTLPQNATALDFAYSVHTELGDHAVHAWVDKKLSPLRYRLKSGQTVQIITAPSAHPRTSWLDFVATGKARTAIRHYLKKLALEDAVQLGHRILDRTLANYQRTLEQIEDGRLQEVLEETRSSSLQDLLREIALGNLMPTMVAAQLVEVDDSAPEAQAEAIRISGGEGDVVSFGNCCFPLPGDRIIGFLSAGKGLVVHRAQCRNVKEFRKTPERVIPVVWDPEKNRMFAAGISIEVHNRPGVLAEIAATISHAGCNIEHVQNRDRDGETSTVSLTITVRDRNHLAQVMRKVRRLGPTMSVRRR